MSDDFPLLSKRRNKISDVISQNVAPSRKRLLDSAETVVPPSKIPFLPPQQQMTPQSSTTFAETSNQNQKIEQRSTSRIEESGDSSLGLR
jgi:hypothetical protein